MEKIKYNFEGSDEVDIAATNAASDLIDEFYNQNNLGEDRDETWYELQEELREKILGATTDVINEFIKNH
jgi:hypothetical protein